MAVKKDSVKLKSDFVYGLDIGTRSIVGTVGYPDQSGFVVAAQTAIEHETRAMIDGQIHDIAAVGATIRRVTDELEKALGTQLKSVCIAAAGRVLRTVTTHVDMEFDEEKTITREDIFALDSLGIEKSYESFLAEKQTDLKFYCVGYTVMRYHLNHYPMSNLENHKARSISADLIATFLPDEVVDGLYKAVEMAGLEVANLTLEPIAAMELAIPESYRMLNIALIDVGAGTSDISITRGGSIVAYGMLPVAGDLLTEEVAGHCLVDFATAEQIKRGISDSDEVEYKDIMGLTQKIKAQEVLDTLSEKIDMLATQAADKIMELNGDKPVSAVFVVGGGGKIAGYTDIVADKLGIARERCALRGKEVMQKITFLQKDIIPDSLLVTPIGICLNFYQQSNNFIFVTFNGNQIKLYDNNHLAVVDAAMGAGFPNEDLFPKRGKELHYTLNGEEKSARGQLGESCRITLNGKPADLNAAIHSNDVISVEPSTAGGQGSITLARIAGRGEKIKIHVNGDTCELPKYASVNGELATGDRQIEEGDKVEILSYYTVAQVAQVCDLNLDGNSRILINHEESDENGKVYDNFSLEVGIRAQSSEDTANEGENKTPEKTRSAMSYAEMTYDDLPDGDDEDFQYEKEAYVVGGRVVNAGDNAGAAAADNTDAAVNGNPANQTDSLSGIAATQVNVQPQTAGQLSGQGVQNGQGAQSVNPSAAQTAHSAYQTVGQAVPSMQPTQQQPTTQQPTQQPAQQPTPQPDAVPVQPAAPKAERRINVIINGLSYTMKGKPAYVYVDAFDYIEFDLSRPQGKTVETLLNGRKAQYMEELHDGDVLLIAWKN